jgi:hypothetical protein
MNANFLDFLPTDDHGLFHLKTWPRAAQHACELAASSVDGFVSTSAICFQNYLYKRVYFQNAAALGVTLWQLAPGLIIFLDMVFPAVPASVEI